MPRPPLPLPRTAAEPLSRARAQFSFTYDSYMLHAFPRDELRPLSCAGHVRAATRRGAARPTMPRSRGVPGPRRTRWGATR